MPETLFNRDFSAGWTPSDDEVSGRQNGLLQMDNLELDRNGALTLTHGTQVVWNGYPALAHTMFSRFMCGTRYDYAALDNGSVWKNNQPLIPSGGDGYNAAFGTAFDFVLVCSGAQRIKDGCSGFEQLGINPPTIAPTVTQNALNAPWAIVSPAISYSMIPSQIAVVAGSASNAGGANYLNIETNAAPGPGIVNPNMAVIQAVNYPVSNLNVLSSVAGSGTSTDNDFITLNGYTPNPFGLSLQFDVLLEPGDAAGDQVNNFYTYTIPDIATNANFDAYSGAFTIRMRRVDFQRIGGGVQDWSTTYGFRMTFIGAPLLNINVWGLAFGESIVMQGGTAAQFGTYQYAQINVNNTGTYIAKSTLGPTSPDITINGNSALVTPQNPTTVDPQCNEAWIFRRSVNGQGNLGQWYRVLVFNSTTGFGPQYDTMSDQAALTLDITINLNLISVQQIPGKVYDIIGPIQGRWYYFTLNMMYPSDVDDPDLVDASIAIRTCGSDTELFFWARSVSATVVLVGTSVDCYLLTGTFATFPDGSVDVYYQSVGVKFPPVTYDAVSYGGTVYYLGSDGWRTVQPTSFGTTYSAQNNQLIVSPNLDRLYRGEACYGYFPPEFPTSPGLGRFPITIGKNKIWCFPFGVHRCEVYDFVRQYWRAITFNLGDASACTTTQDNKILVFYPQDRVMREIDYMGSKLIDGTRQQAFNVLFPYKDNGKPRQRKDTYTFKTRCATGTGYMQLQITDEQGTIIPVNIAIRAQGNSAEEFVDISQAFGSDIPKSYKVNLYGISDDVFIEDWSIIYDPHPEPLTFLRIQPNNLGSPAQKRLRTWPFVIDSMGNYVVFTPNVDGVIQAKTTTFQSNYRKTCFHYFTDDVFGYDYGGTLTCTTGMMEVWSTGLDGNGPAPDIVQTLPVPHEYDQVGPLEIFRWGKIVKMALRTQSSGTPIPFKIFVSDQMIWASQFNVTPGVEDEYIVDLPKGTSGRILRVELGPCPFTFSRYYMKFQVAISGAQKDTELSWITVPGLSAEMVKGV